MTQTKRAATRMGSTKVASVLGLAGVSLAASTGGSAADMPVQNLAPFPLVTLDDEEISDVSLATFHLFDQESLGAPQARIQLARGGCGCGGGGCGHGGCGGGGCGHGGCGGGGCGHGGCGGGFGRGCGGGFGRGCGGGCGWGGCGGCGYGWGWGGCCLGWGGCSPFCYY